MNTTTITNTPKSATRSVRRSGNTIPAYFLGRPRARWTAALTPFTAELATAA